MSPPPEHVSTFGIDSAEIASLAYSWRRSGRVLANLDVDDFENTTGIARCMSAVRGAAAPAKRVSINIANRLDVLSQIVERFEGTATADDEAAGRVLRGLADR